MVVGTIDSPLIISETQACHDTTQDLGVHWQCVVERVEWS